MQVTRRFRAGAATAIVAVVAMSLATPDAAKAVTVPVYATWTAAGGAGAFTGTMTLGPGLPAATWTSNSTSGSGTGLQTGASTWLPAGSPFGAVYGSSENQQYVNLRPAANGAGSPSTTTYTFATPMPAGSWAFAVGDIDADAVQVTATDADGNAVTVADLGFQGAFNYCDASPRASTCSGQVAPYDLPVWSDATGTLTGNVIDTAGASGWFRPAVALSSLTLLYSWQTGQPVYQTWFATLTRSVTGTVTHDGVGHGGVELTLTGPDGTTLATTTTAADGTYAFDGYGAVPGYTVTMTTPAGLEPVGPATRTVDLTTTDGVADFGLTTPAPVTYPVTGVVTDSGGTPVSGAQVTLAEPDGTAVSATTTDTTGRYTFPAVEAGSYRVSVAPSATFQGGFTDIQVPLTADVPTIAVAAQPPTPTIPPELPATGHQAAFGTSAIAMLVLAIGASLALVGRRRRLL